MDLYTLRSPSGMCSLSTVSKDSEQQRCIGHNHRITEDSRACFCGAWVFVASYSELSRAHWQEQR